MSRHAGPNSSCGAQDHAKGPQMNNLLSMSGLIVNLTSRNEQPKSVGASPTAFDTDPRAPRGYVEHEMEIADWPQGARGILIEAPAAVGKSACANALAQRLNWPLIHAEVAQVGSWSLKGLIWDCTGWDSPYISEIAAGGGGIVVDALDEAQLRAGLNNFLAFIQDAASLCNPSSSASHNPAVVLLSRPDTAEIVRIQFAELGVPIVHLRLQFLSKVKVEEYVRKYLSVRSEETERREYAAALDNFNATAKLLERRIAEISTALVGSPEGHDGVVWNEVAPFLGYPPVLSTLAESLAVANPVSAPRLCARDKASLLREVLNSILDREQQKFVDSVGLKLKSLVPAALEHGDFAATLYTPYEQLSRLLSRVQEMEYSEGLPIDLPNEVRGHYESAVEEFLPNHPFLMGARYANIVFADFVSAELWRGDGISAPQGSGRARRGPFFLRFLRAALSDDAKRIPESLINDLLDSWHQENELLQEAALATIVLTEDASRLEFASISNDEKILFEVTDATGVAVFSSALKYVNVIADAVVLGVRNMPLEMGPEVCINATEVEFECESLSVPSREGGASVKIATQKLRSNYLQRVSVEQGQLEIFSPEVPAKLHPYLKPQSDDQDELTGASLFMDLRTILSSFETGIEGAPSCFYEKMDQRIVQARPSRASMLSALVRAEVVTRKDNFYYLDRDALLYHGVRLSDIHSGRQSPVVWRAIGSLMRD